MPVTRRQTRQSVAHRSEPPAESSLSEDNEGFFEDTDDDDVPRAANRRKRARVSTANVTRRAQAGQRGKKFELLSLSPELLDKVLSAAHPRTLLRLAWTCRKLRDKLMSRMSAPIWKAARDCSGVLECPEEVSELRWAHLLCGPPHCFTCGAHNIHTIIFPFRRRACVPCMKKNMVWEKKFKEHFCEYDPELLGLVPYSNVGPWAHGHQSTGKFYWKPDIQQMLATLGEHTAAVAASQSGAQQALKKWKAERRVRAAEVCEETPAQNTWSEDDGCQGIPRVDTRTQRKQIVEAKLLEEGWDAQDIRALGYTPATAPAKAELTAGAWTTIKKKLEPELQELKQQRLAREREPILKKRRALVQNIYMARAKSVAPSLWCTLPPSTEVYKMPPFAEVINRDVCIEVTEADFVRASEQLPSLLSTWLAEKMEELTKGIILPSFSDVQTAVNIARPEDLDLAVSVFVCDGPTSACDGSQSSPKINGVQPRDKFVPFIGLSEVLRHERKHQNLAFRWPWNSSPGKMVFNERGCLAALTLLMALKLDPRTTRPVDMDRLETLFRCTHCLNVHRGTLGYIVMDWRRCISHYIEMDDGDHPAPSWTVCEASEYRNIRAEMNLQAAARLRSCSEWACARCDADCFDWKTREVVEKHLAATHHVTDPKELRDYLWAGSGPRPMLAPRFISYGPAPHANPLAVFLCMQCPRSTRTFVLDGVRSHITAVHKIAKPDLKQGVHFRAQT